MCSICGYFSVQEKPTTVVVDMLQKTKHRGPDACGIYTDGEIFKGVRLEELKSGKSTRICIGHSRLSIVGGEDSVQPFISCDGSISLVCNGEIYNYQELQGLLRDKHALKDEISDSEVLLRLIEEMYNGDLLKTTQDVVEMLNGMYVFVVTDGRDVVIARDPIGVKPIYYVEEGKTVFFCSEKKGLWDIGDEIKRVLPGNILCINERGISIEHGAKIERLQIDITDPDEATTLYGDALADAMEKMLRGLNVDKIGMIFSGGVDSVLIAKIISDAGWDLRCYCVGEENSDDVKNAERVAKDLGLSLRTIYINERKVESILPEIIKSIEINGLLQVEVAVPMYLAAKAASEDGVKVMFTGQGADELFAGYSWYKDVLSKEGFLKLHNDLWRDIDLLYDDTLEREDKVTMAHSVELRVPYLDGNVVRCAMRISPELKIKDKNDPVRKWVHRNVASLFGVPDYIAYRPKDAAQSGSGIHLLMKKIAEEHFKNEEIENVELEDRGSNYRYLNEEYGTNAMWAYLDEVTRVNHCLGGEG